MRPRNRWDALAEGAASNTVLDQGIARLFALLDPEREGLLSRELIY